MSPFGNDSVVRATIKKKPATATPNKVSNVTKILGLGIMALGVVISNSLLPITAGQNSRRDTINVLGGIETSADCTSTGCIQPIVGITESMDLYNLSGSYVIGEPANPRCELSSTGALQGSSCVITAGVTILSTPSGMLTQSAADARYVNTSGDTMTGTLLVKATLSGSRLVISGNSNLSGALVVVGNITMRGTMSGNVLHVEKTLTSSGTITAEGTISGSLLTGRTISGNTLRAKVFTPFPLGATVIGSGATVTTGSGKNMVTVWNPAMSGAKLCGVTASVMVAGTTNATSVQIRNLDKGNRKMLSTPVQIDSTHTKSNQSATPAVINQANADVGFNDRLVYDVPNVSTTAPKVLQVVPYFCMP